MIVLSGKQPSGTVANPFKAQGSRSDIIRSLTGRKRRPTDEDLVLHRDVEGFIPTRQAEPVNLLTSGRPEESGDVPGSSNHP